ATALRVTDESRPAKGRPPLRSAPWPLLAVAPCGRPLWVHHGQPLAGWPQTASPAGGRPLRVVAPAVSRPLQVADSPLAGGPWLQPVAPAGGGWPWPTAPLQGALAAAGYPLQLATASPSSSLFLLRMHPDGEDEGGQASSSLAVSTRSISAGKLLQSGLATLAQREGGE
ncbi:hypothetical protein GW17_00061738, partial [Ensete ventricosum]